MPRRLERGPRRPRVPSEWRFAFACLAVFLLIWTALAIAPRDRPTWVLENLPTAVVVPLLVFTARRFRFSDRAYFQGTVFLILHTIGSHYTYSETPIGNALAALFGWPRNHYDRVVHFAFGALVYRPLLELDAAGSRKAFHAVAAIALFSVSYEIVEWLMVLIAAPEAGIAFLGSQGDPWDAQKDMALALLGGAAAMALEPLFARQVASRRSMARAHDA